MRKLRSHAMYAPNTKTDQATRDRALDITSSFIVQAPAGSGKTALLTQRVLALLGQANEPEECLAITFTRKAAAEMRERILLALHDAYQNKPVFAEYDSKTRRLAEQVLQRNKIRNWNLFDNPNRLKIQTIDSLNVSLTRRMPILSGFGALPEIVTDANDLYALAVNAVLNESVVDVHYMPSLNVILKHLDNDRERIKKLFVSLLPLREQWLPYIIQTQSESRAKEILELGLKTVVIDLLQQLTASIPAGLLQLPTIAAIAGRYMQEIEPNSAIVNCSNLVSWPEANIADLKTWIGIAELLLTKEGSLRKTVTQAQGFPSPAGVKDKTQKTEVKAHKQNMLECLSLLQDQSIFCENLRLLSYLPALEYSEQQWQFMAALVHILPLLVAQLTIIFREKGQIDLPEVSMAARMALGSPDAPSDLALALDYKVLHILVDEFQDTSIAQFKLIEHLVSGWMPEDGKTLFLVGDPMQSIYRFRQAEVGLFMNAQRYGIGGIKLTPLYLTANFRSTPQIIQWINTVFKGIFPAKNNMILGEVAYSDSMPTSNSNDGVVKFLCFKNEDDAIEAQQIVKLIHTRKEQYPAETIAILVRSRSHLPRLIAELNNAKISYQGVEIELLTNKPIIQDILALTKALLHLNDRISWLAILRAPWCGLTLQDLQALVGENFIGCIWERLQSFEQCLQLSADGKERLRFVTPILAVALATRDRQSLMELVYNTWLALSGHLCVSDLQSMEDIQVFFELLRIHNNNKNIFEIGFWERQLTRLFSRPKCTEDSAVQIMTIHKAKGLEFDTVILPGLGRKPIIQEDRLFRWEERTSLKGTQHLIFAPIKAVGLEHDPIYKFLKYTDQIRDHYELARLLYVATTRAKKALFGFASNLGDKPPTFSMLALIANYISQEEGANDEEKLVSTPALKQKPYVIKLPQTLRRLPLVAYKQTDFPSVITSAANQSRDQNRIASALKAPRNDEYRGGISIVSDCYIRQVGIVVHKVFWQITTFGLQAWLNIYKTVLEQQWTNMLLTAGVPRSKLKENIEIVQAAVTNTLADPTGRWILDNTHQAAKSEWSLTALINDQPRQIIIDRTFIDQQGIRWIIDYKICNSDKNEITAHHKYNQQLKLYQQILQMLFPNTVIKTKLYFPLQAKDCILVL